MRYRVYLYLSGLLLFLLSLPTSALASPILQDGTPVYGLLGTLHPSEENAYETVLETRANAYPVVGATPALELQIQRLAAQEDAGPVKVWGRFVDALEESEMRQLVVEELLLVAAPDPTPASVDVTPIPDQGLLGAITAARATVRTAPSVQAELIGQLREGDPVEVVARDASDRWWRVCCVDGRSGWVVRLAVELSEQQRGDLYLPVLTEGSSTMTPTATPLPTPVPLPETDWRASYYDNISLQGEPLLTHRVNAVSDDWGTGSPAPGVVPSDRFSARYERVLSLNNGFYEFTVQADDGVRVWIGGEQVVDEWHMAEPPVYRFSRRITEPTPVRIEYFEVGGKAAISFDYRLVSQFPDWKASYFDTIDLAGGPDWIRAEPLTDIALSHYWSLGSPVPGVIPDDNWSARWTGTYEFEGGNYLFWARADDGVRLWIDDVQVLNAWETGGGYVEEIFYRVGAGEHTITIEYYERGGLARIEADWRRLGANASDP